MKKGNSTCSFPILEGIRKTPTSYILEKMSANNIHLKIVKKGASSFLDVLGERMAKSIPIYPTEQTEMLLCEAHG